MAAHAASNASFAASAAHGFMGGPGSFAGGMPYTTFGRGTVSPTAGLNDPVLQVLRDIDLQNHMLVGITREQWNLQRSTARPAFVPPGAHAPPPTFVSPGTGAASAGIGIPTPPGGWMPGTGGAGLPPVPGFLVPATAGGGGGGRTGGGGGGGTGGGYGRHGRPWRPSTWLKAAGMGGAAEFGSDLIELAESLLLAPQKIGQMAGAALASSQPYIRLNMDTYAMGRAGGYSGYGLMRGLFPGQYRTPEWMKAFGISPQEGSALAMQFGIVPGSQSDYFGTIRALAGMGFSPGLSGIASQGRAFAGHMAQYGLVGANAGSIERFSASLSDVMENAITQGLDRASVLRSIEAAVSFSARSGAAGIGLRGIENFLFRFTGLPGGRTGEAGLQAMHGLQRATSEIGTAPLQTTMAARMAASIHSRTQLEAILGPAAYEKTMASPEGRAAVANLLESNRNHDSAGAWYWYQALIAGNPQAQYKTFSQPEFYRGLPPELVPVAVGHVTGMGPMKALAMQLHLGGLNDAQAAAKLGNMLGNQLTYDPKKGDAFYKEALLRMGVRPDLISDMIAQGKKENVNPLLLGGITGPESTFGYDTRKGAYGMPGSVNVMQIAGSGPMPRPANAAQSIAEGAALLHRAIAQPHSTMLGVLEAYRGRGHLTPQYALEVESNMIRAGAVPGTVPHKILDAQAEAFQTAIAGSATSFHELSVVMPKVNDALNGLTKAANGAAAAMGRVRHGLPAPQDAIGNTPL